MPPVPSSADHRPSAPAAPPRRSYYAHTASDAQGNALPESSGKWQPLAEHLRNVAELAAKFAAPFGMAAEAELAGALHDLGKYAERFQARLRNPSIHGINHWAAGACQAQQMSAGLVAYAVDGHHTGLPAHGRLREALARMAGSDTREGWTGGCAEAVSDLVAHLAADRLCLPPQPPLRRENNFAAALRARMLFSALVDADFLDTEKHFEPAAASQRRQPPLDPHGALGLLMAHLRTLPAGSIVGQIRSRVLDECLRAAEKPPGLFSLTAPTGSGKTLASLAFALRHAVHRNSSLAPDHPGRLRRIIVVIPYTSIIEQTAAVYRALLAPAFGPDYVLEHHGAVGPSEPHGRDADAEDAPARRARLAAQDWSAPLVVTTSVQFFESLFAYKPGRCRKLHQIARSVLIFDEVQTLPPNLLPSLLSAVRLLTQEPYGATALFMTATQPAFAAARSALPLGWPAVPVETSASDTAGRLRRTSIRLPQRGERTGWPELAERMAALPQALCVLNTTGDARQLFRLLPPEGRFHLSARMCPEHRKQKLRAIRRELAAGRACRLASTQVIEAGVDVDFPAAFRAMGPLDSIIQTAGRCNREGRLGPSSPVVVFRPLEDHFPPGAYSTAAALTEGFLARYLDAEQRLHDPAFYASYFAELYALVGRDSARDDPLFASSESFDFPEAAKNCRLIPDDTRAVLVNWCEGEELIGRLRCEKHLLPRQWRAAQRFSINLYQGEFVQAQARGYVTEIVEGVWRWASDYHEDLGACHPEGSDYCL
jgi:CRISPR-associated endonuclease/helicase Cas3